MLSVITVGPLLWDTTIQGTSLFRRHKIWSRKNVSAQRKSCSIARGLVDFAIGLVIFVLNLPDGQVLFFGEIQITEGL